MSDPAKPAPIPDPAATPPGSPAPVPPPAARAAPANPANRVATAPNDPPVPAAPLNSRRKIEPLKEMSFQEAGWKQMGYDALAAAGVMPDDVLEREYWAHVSQARLRSMTKIHIMAEDRSWYGELIVWQAYTNGALVSFIHPPVYLDKAGLTREETEYDVFDGGLSKEWCVRRIKDGRVIKDGCASKAEAELFLTSWLKSQGNNRRAA